MTTRLASGNRFNDLDAVAVPYELPIVLGSAHHAIIARHGDTASRGPKQLEQRADGQLVG